MKTENAIERRSASRVLTVLASLGASVVLAGCPLGGIRVDAGENVTYDAIHVAGEKARGGIYDPSIAYDADGRTGWLAYSAIHGPEKPVGPYVEVHVARSTDQGRTWRYAATVQPSTDATIDLDGARHDGAWRFEVPTLIHDPGDPDAPWKIFSHKYFWSRKKDRMPTHGWITLHTARDPAGPWSKEVALFGAGKFPPAPYDKTQIDANTLDPKISKTVAYTEPGALERDGVIYLSLTAHKPGLGGPAPDLVLLSSRDHAKTWRFAGVLASAEDARPFDAKFLDAPALAEQDGRVFLLVSPDKRKPMHDGTLVIEFEDLVRGKLKREGGKLSVHKYIPGQKKYMTRLGAGQACYSEHNAPGLIMAEAAIETLPALFQIWSTGEDLISTGSRAPQR